jgi:CDGSH-type Zn-finger protein/ferredoxin
MADEPSRTRITVAPAGPYIVEGIAGVTGADGQAVPAQPRMVLCRCGQSANKPFCDGAHAARGFTGETAAQVGVSKTHLYRGQELTGSYNRTICAHAAACVTGLPAVFDMNARPWIQPDNSEAEAVIETIRACPSGALNYSIEEQTPVDPQTPTAITVQPNGPLAVDGPAELVGDGLQRADGGANTKCTLCRCGASDSSPFCDGSHATSGFQDPA